MYDEMCLDTFLAQQEKLFREPVAESREEAEEFLSDCFATVCENLKEVRAYFKEEGADIAEHTGVGGRVGARGAANGRLVNADDLIDPFHTLNVEA